MSKFKPIDIDAEFEDVHFDEAEITKQTALIKRIENGWMEKNAIATKNRRQEWKENISNTAKVVRQKEGWRDNWLISIKNRNQSDQYKIKHKVGIEKRTKSLDWQEKNKIKAKKLCKAVVTPDGLFSSVKDAIEFYNKTRNTKYAESWLMAQRRKFPDQFYTISLDEYKKRIK